MVPIHERVLIYFPLEVLFDAGFFKKFGNQLETIQESADARLFPGPTVRGPGWLKDPYAFCVPPDMSTKTAIPTRVPRIRRRRQK